ncbi:uncharacterized protein NECHADRAFT_95095 [Fusarium vanettenii 77-13-4]|uniref:Uncharacterized protein n=1 Tax=Fusarium vanettenii (strain ATCC MYA-4622 / CBS 123669 / FGSC 9596 / NRRL 45880 / 77-13-4) TaxID=660122 RepID=C7YXA8_FUSV7|nr:uncharacterized protein NECHADRAFT_95095 [Fusarium vanettenii 77-13-4]EEU43795.1 hypothetical protein NECHADRAFT_95095 [Fusarium vanettenii 77-13-4]
METPLTNPYPDQMNTHAQQEESILAGDGTRPVSPLENNPRPESANEKTCTRICNSWEGFLLRPWKMFLILLIGVIFAVGHHLFYLHLDGKEGDAQSLMFRYGTIIAFCAKTSFGTAVTMAFQQRAWLVVRRRTARLDTVDSIFTANTEFMSLVDWRAIKRAKISTCLALYCWLTPLVVILTSETLSTVVWLESASCPSVRTLNFDNEAIADWRLPVKINDHMGISVSLWNSTEPGKDQLDITKGETDYWNRPSMQYARQLLPPVLCQGQPTTRKKAGVAICSDNWDCSYVISFVGPGYKCQQLASGVGSKVKKLGESEAPFDTSDIVPEGNFTYLAQTKMGEYGEQQLATSGPGGRPSFSQPYPKNLGAFRTEPIIWIGYATVNDTSLPQPMSREDPDWYDAYTPVIFGCEHYEINYTVKFEYIRGEQSQEIIGRDYMKKVVNTTYLAGEGDLDKRLRDRTVATPEENYVFPRDVRSYKRTAAFHSLGHGLRSYLDGKIKMPYAIAETDIVLTSLITHVNLLPVDNLPSAIEKLYEDIIVSLLSNPAFLAVSWASNGKPSGYARGGPDTNYPCVRTRPSTIFRYDMLQLVAVYLVSFVLALIGVLLGFQAACEEGLMRDMKPSSIIEATRAPSLNELGPGGELDKNNVRVGYGLVQQHAGGSLRSFGLEGDGHLLWNQDMELRGA